MGLHTFMIIAIVVGSLVTLCGKIGGFFLYCHRINKIPGPKFSIPLFGMMFKIIFLEKRDRLEFYKKLGEQEVDGIARVWKGFYADVYIRKAEHAQVLLRSNTEIKKSTPYNYITPWLGQGLITSTGTQWFHHRKIITPAFHYNVLQDFAEVVIEKSATLSNSIEQRMKISGDEPFDILDLVLKCTIDVICEAAMGTNIFAKDMPQSQYIKAIQDITDGIFERATRPWLVPDFIYYRTSYGKSFQAAVDTADYYGTRVIKRKMHKRKSNSQSKGQTKRKAFLDLLLEANENEGNPMTLDDIRDEINTFLFTGYDTVGSLIGWTFFCLGNHLEVQKKVQEELDEILGDADAKTTVTKLPELDYLNRVIKEVLRLHPSVSMIGRQLLNDMKIGDHIVPAGTNVSVQIHELHRDPTVWPDPLRFDPDRFLPENSQDRHPYAYVPFSAGPRNCIGKKAALLEAQLIIAQIMRKYNIKSVEKHSTVDMYNDVILRPCNGILVNMSKRSTEVK